MQTPKSRKSSSTAPQKNSPKSSSSPSDIPQKSSPQACSSEGSQKASPRIVRQLKTGPRYFEHTASSLNLATKPPKEQSPKVTEHRSPRSSTSEKKRPGRVSELESQVSLLENDLSALKDQLCAAEASKKKAEEDAEVANEQISGLSSKLDELQRKLSDNISSNGNQEQSQALNSELQEKNSSDSSALASALEENKQLKVKREVLIESEATHLKNYETAQGELNQLKQNLSETQLLVEEMEVQLKQSEESEARAQEMVRETLIQLENAKKTMGDCRLDRGEGHQEVTSDLEKSRARVSYLEELVGDLKAKINANSGQNNEIEYAETEIGSEKLVEAAKSESRDSVKTELQTHKDLIEELKAKLLDKETELQGICEENEGLTKKLQGEEELKLELDKSRADLDNLRALLADKENEWQNIAKENDRLNSVIKESIPNTENIESIEDSEREALAKVDHLMDEVEKSNRKVARIIGQLDAMQSTNTEMEAELRRIKVQSDQWRKAAEAAAAMLSAGGNNGQQLMERTGSMDSHYSPRMKKMGSPYADDLDEDLLKKKNANLLRRFWKKPQK